MRLGGVCASWLGLFVLLLGQSALGQVEPRVRETSPRELETVPLEELEPAQDPRRERRRRRAPPSERRRAPSGPLELERAAPLPDLSIGDLRLSPGSPEEGQPVQAEARIRNSGPEPVEVRVRFLLGGDPVGREQVVRVPARGERPVRLRFRAQAGELRVVVDPADQVRESNERNNTATRQLALGGAPTMQLLAGSGSGIQVTSPGILSLWYKGQTYDIQWTSAASVGNRVHIELRAPGGAKVLTIANKANNTGKYSWTVPAKVANGDYFVYVSNLKGDIFGYSQVLKIDQVYTVQSDVSKLKFVKFTNPKGGETWKVGVTYSIQWTSGGATGPEIHLALELVKKKDPASAVLPAWSLFAPSTPNDGQYTYKIPPTVEGTYKLVARVPNEGPVGESLPFEVVFSNPPTLTVLAPKAGDVWKAGGSYAIQWSAGGYMESDSWVQIFVVDATGLVVSIYLPPTPHPKLSAGKYTWKIPANQKPGNYRMELRASTGIWKKSEVFQITASAGP